MAVLPRSKAVPARASCGREIARRKAAQAGAKRRPVTNRGVLIEDFPEAEVEGPGIEGANTRVERVQVSHFRLLGLGPCRAAISRRTCWRGSSGRIDPRQRCGTG